MSLVTQQPILGSRGRLDRRPRPGSDRFRRGADGIRRIPGLCAILWWYTEALVPSG